ncbi:MAG: hypothetical protein CM15mP46_0200 [Alphaproteobacteria bacterium]|nr:MAG: hypothetical protein CM15mP46_0200 [Alphaproteobacteria bacterium]
MGLFFLLGFILWGWAEMSAFIYIGGEIGGLFTLLGIFVTAIIGLSFVKSQGNAVMTKIRTDLAQGRAPVGSIADSISLAVGGILMLIPGYVTDAVGILLFMPGVRKIAGAWILHHLVTSNRFKGFVHVDGQAGFSTGVGFRRTKPFHHADDVIEGDATEHQPPKDRLSNR